MTSLEALGLMYTNVEADQSPTRQRGFQVWQASAGLSAEVRREITRRVDDYRAPIGTPPDSTAFTRDAYFPVAGGFAVARTVPLAGKDKFGRGGRFFAHVLVARADDFAGLHHDPFALFDAAEFEGDPERVKALHPDWLKGVLPTTRLTLKPAAAAQHAGPVRALLAGHIDRAAAQRKTVVIVGKPAEVAAELRKVYRGLPPQVRAAAEFDTMSAGVSLTQVPCAFAGCPAAESLKMWAFRRFARFDPAAGTLTPADAPPHGLPAALPGTDAWATADDPARAAAWAAAIAIGAERLPEAAEALEADDGALAILESTPGFPAALDGLRERWRAQCPAVVTAVPGVSDCLEKYLAVPFAERLRRLQGDVPREPITAILLDQISMRGYRGHAGALDDIHDWQGKRRADSTSQRLDWVLSRLRYRNADELGAVLTVADDADSKWFRGWVRSYFEVMGITAATLSGELSHDLEESAVKPETVYDAELYLLCGPNEPPDEMQKLRFRHASRSGGFMGLDWKTDLPDRGEIVDYFRPRVVLGWTMLSDFKIFTGAFVYPRVGVEGEAALLDYITHLLRDQFGPQAWEKKTMARLLPETAWPKSGKPPNPDPDSTALTAFLTKLKSAKQLDARKRGELCREVVQSEAFFNEVIGNPIPSFTFKPFAELPSTLRPHEAALFGCRADPTANATTKDYLPNLLDIVLSAVTPEIDRESYSNAREAASFQDREKLTRFLSWM